MSECNICPRKCSVDRDRHKGFCGQSNRIRAARAALHFWEEPCISGTKGSGAVFFSGCSLRCVYCQNSEIAAGSRGIELSEQRLSEIFLKLEEQGANNINLVTPTHFIPGIAGALTRAKGQGLHLPVVYNSSGYEDADVIKSLEGLVDIYLPDFKYVSSDIALRYSHAEDYFEKASGALVEMVRQKGKAEFVLEGDRGRAINREMYQELCDEDTYIMTKGVIVRHLLLPGYVSEAKKVVDYLLRRHGDDIFISLLHQYTPFDNAKGFSELSRRVTPEEYDELVEYAVDRGLEYGFIQDEEAADESFLPEFDGTGIL